MHFQRRVATPFSRTGQIYRSGLPPIRYARSLSYSAFRIKCSLMLLQQLSPAHAPARDLILSLQRGWSSKRSSSVRPRLPPPATFPLPDFPKPPGIAVPPCAVEFLGQVASRSQRSPRQRSHCCALNNPLSLNYDARALSHPATVLRSSNTLPKTREPPFTRRIHRKGTRLGLQPLDRSIGQRFLHSKKINDSR